MAKQATINGMWVGMSFDRAIQEAKFLMEANAAYGEFNDMAMKRAYQTAERRLARLHAAQTA